MPALIEYGPVTQAAATGATNRGVTIVDFDDIPPSAFERTFRSARGKSDRGR